MKKINLKGISEILSEKELKNVTGGVGQVMFANVNDRGDGGGTGDCYALRPCDSAGDCMGRICGQGCTQSSSGRVGKCVMWLCHGSFLGLPTAYGTTCAVGLT